MLAFFPPIAPVPCTFLFSCIVIEVAVLSLIMLLSGGGVSVDLIHLPVCVHGGASLTGSLIL